MPSAESELLAALERLALPARGRRRTATPAALVSALTHLIDERIGHLLGARRGTPKAATLPEVAFFSALMMAQELKVSVQTVRNLEKNGTLFSMLSAVRQRGRVYPAFLATWVSSLAGTELMQALVGLPGAQKYEFFTTPREELQGLTPLTLWTGQAGVAGVTADQSGLLHQRPAARERLVMKQALKAADSWQRRCARERAGHFSK
jgi:hypothetical protein